MRFVVRQIAENLAHANVLVGAIGQCIPVSFAYITSPSRLRKGKVSGLQAGVRGGRKGKGWTLQYVLWKARGSSGTQSGSNGKESGSRRTLHTVLYLYQL